MSVVVGRSRELGAVGALLGDVSAGPAVLVLEGPAGIGKTVVWRAGVDQAPERDLAALVWRRRA